jgi:excisionase family DNA binding protein
MTDDTTNPTTAAMLPDVLTPPQVAQYLGLPLSTVWAALRRGEIPAAFVARRYRVRREDLLGLFAGKSARGALAVAPSPTPVVLPDRVERLGRPGRPRKPRRRSVARPEADGSAEQPHASASRD